MRWTDLAANIIIALVNAWVCARLVRRGALTRLYAAVAVLVVLAALIWRSDPVLWFVSAIVGLFGLTWVLRA